MRRLFEAVGRRLFLNLPSILVFLLFIFFIFFPDSQAQPKIFRAGFSRVCITPPIGTGMTGFGDRDYDKGCVGIHDDLFVRALYVTDGDFEILIMGFDLLFFSRDESDRFKGAIGAVLDLSPRQIALNTSHNHTGPKVGTWYYSEPEPFYLNLLEDKILEAAVLSRQSAREVILRAGTAKTSAPMNRRKRMENGTIDLRPNPGGFFFDKIPICFFEDTAGKPVCLLFSVACHPSTIKGDDRAYWISADYPGAALKSLDDHLGGVVSLFLQGAGGDSKLSIIGKDSESWRAGTWEDVEIAGKSIADEVIGCLGKGLEEVKPELSAALTEIELPLESPLERTEYEKMANDSGTIEPMRRWASEQAAIVARGYRLRESVPVIMHGVTLGIGVRLVGIEGEIVGELGALVTDFYGDGITFPLGYTDGAQLYIPTSAMIDEGGYEVESYWEYRHPAPLKKGIELRIGAGLEELKRMGIR